MHKGLTIGLLVVLVTMGAAPLSASPLYGGYNGQSNSWVDCFFFGVDDQQRWWVRIPVVIKGGVLRVNFKYEYTGVVSAEVVIKGLTDQGDFLLGIDTTELTWQELYQPSLSGGSDSEGNAWTEQSILGVLGTGSDSHGNQWGFVGAFLDSALLVRAGVKLLFPEPTGVQTAQVGTYRDLARLLAGLLLDDGLRYELETPAFSSLDLQELLAWAQEEVFTRERRKVIQELMRGIDTSWGFD